MTPPTRSVALSAGLLVAVLAVPGCSGLLPKRPTVQLYEIAPAFAPASAAASAPAGTRPVRAVAIEEIEAFGLTATDRIPVLEAEHRVNPLAGALWERRAPVLVQDVLIRAFEASGRVPLVARGAAGMGEGYVLGGELRRMRAEVRGAGRAEAACEVSVEMALRLSIVPGGAFVAARSFRAVVAARDASPDAIVAAFNGAWEQLAPEVVAWALGAAPGEEATRAAEGPGGSMPR
jgi:cholesterol transport system auxiliary component